MWITQEGDLISSGNGGKKTKQTKTGTKNLVFNLYFYL